MNKPQLTGHVPQGILIRPVVSINGLESLYTLTWESPLDPLAPTRVLCVILPSKMRVLRMVTISSTLS